MRYNVIGDDGMSSVADGLQCNKTLTKLNVWQCGFSVKGTIYQELISATKWALNLCE